MEDSGVFFYNSRGFSFEVQTNCRNLGTPVNCRVTFDHSNGTVSTLGNFGHHDFEPNPDIAGAGIFVALLVQSSWIFFFALLTLYRDQRKRKPIKERHTFGIGLLSAISDSMIILVAVYVLNFTFTGKCNMSTYHYYIGLDSVLIALSSLVVTFTASRHHFWTVGRLLRFLATLALFIYTGIFLGYQLVKHRTTNFPELWPPVKARNDSALLLPVSCFLDPDLISSDSPYARKYENDTRYERLGKPIESFMTFQLWFYPFLATAFIVLILYNILSWFRCCGRNNRTDRKTNSWKKSSRTFSAVILLMCLSFTVVSAVHIKRLRAWTRASGWMRNTSEDDWWSVGQLLPLLTLGCIVFAVLDKFPKEKEIRVLRTHKLHHGMKRLGLR